MEEYTVRSTYTRAESAARRAADIAVILLLCFFLVFILFKVILVPVEVNDENVAELNTGELLLVDRVSRFIADYSVGDIVRADLGSGYAFYRVAAKGGSLYQVRNGKAYLDGELIDESAYGGEWSEYAELDCSVPEDSVLLLPDKRPAVSALDRYLIPYGSIYGETRLRVAPLTRLSFFM